MSLSVAFHGVTPVLRVNDLEASLSYYVSVLGFKMDWRDDDGNSFASVSRGHCQLFLSADDQGNPGSWLWIGGRDVDALYEELLAKGSSGRQPPANNPCGSPDAPAEGPAG